LTTPTINRGRLEGDPGRSGPAGGIGGHDRPQRSTTRGARDRITAPRAAPDGGGEPLALDEARVRRERKRVRYWIRKWPKPIRIIFGYPLMVLDKIAKYTAALFLVNAVIAAVMIAPLNWRNPSSTAFIDQTPNAIQDFVSIDNVSRNLLALAMAQEDAAYATRKGAFDLGLFYQRVSAYLSTGEISSGSTIPQELAKNLYLSPAQNAWRKGAEAVIAQDLHVLLSRERLLELWVNYIQFGPQLYGICDASWYYFNQPPSYLQLDQAAQLVGLIPSPVHVRRGDDGGLDFTPFVQKADATGDPHHLASYRTVNNAVGRYSGWFAEYGYRHVWKTGVTGYAADAAKGPDSCSTMPPGVRDLLVANGYTVPDRPTTNR
jgi:monofunctional biosynthetic peptidoglycan transglycosylase